MRKILAGGHDRNLELRVRILKCSIWSIITLCTIVRCRNWRETSFLKIMVLPTNSEGTRKTTRRMIYIRCYEEILRIDRVNCFYFFYYEPFKKSANWTILDTWSAAQDTPCYKQLFRWEESKTNDELDDGGDVYVPGSVILRLWQDDIPSGWYIQHRTGNNTKISLRHR